MKLFKQNDEDDFNRVKNKVEPELPEHFIQNITDMLITKLNPALSESFSAGCFKMDLKSLFIQSF